MWLRALNQYSTWDGEDEREQEGACMPVTPAEEEN